MTDALGYLRVSGRGQIDGGGFRRQDAAIAAYACANGLQIVATYRDAGVSGTTELSDRTGLAALLDHVESNGVRTVLVERADRLARDLMVGEIILGQFRDLGVRVVAADCGTDLTAADDDPTRKLIRQVPGAIAEFDKSVTVAKLRAARDRQRRQNGRREGVRPYGERPGELTIIERIRKLRRQRPNGRAMSARAIAETLNADGQRARGGGPWRHSTIAAILGRKRGQGGAKRRQNVKTGNSRPR